MYNTENDNYRIFYKLFYTISLFNSIIKHYFSDYSLQAGVRNESAYLLETPDQSELSGAFAHFL